MDAAGQNVVYLSGDIHCCNMAEISLRGTPEAEQIKMFLVTSSPFYWPFPFADGEPSDFVHDSHAEGQGGGRQPRRQVRLDAKLGLAAW